MRQFYKRAGLAALVGAALAQPAQAGGFSLPAADTDILFTEGNLSVRVGGYGIFANQGFNSVAGVRTRDENYLRPLGIPTFAVKFKIAPAFSCALTHSVPYGANVKYGLQAQVITAGALLAQGRLPNATRGFTLDSQEFAATCLAGLPVGPGFLYALGGPLLESIQYRDRSSLGTLKLDSNGVFGYRAGLGYAIPEYALRLQVLYRSEVEHKAGGSFTPGFVAPLIGLRNVLPATGGGITPQSVKVTAQTGIAPGWLAYGSFTWVNWSVLPRLDFEIAGLGPSSKVLNFRDGYTLQGGVGHVLTERLSGTVNVTWDRRTGNEALVIPESTAVGVGLEYKLDWGKVAAGVSVARLGSGVQSFRAGAQVDGRVGSGYAVAVGTSYLLEF
jgi:long-chain fatty acid transport protein